LQTGEASTEEEQNVSDFLEKHLELLAAVEHQGSMSISRWKVGITGRFGREETRSAADHPIL
jgi:hypothetical protein